jgi:hypothetical protein
VLLHTCGTTSHQAVAKVSSEVVEAGVPPVTRVEVLLLVRKAPSGAAFGSFLGMVFAQAFQQASQAVQQLARHSVQAFASYEDGMVQLR